MPSRSTHQLRLIRDRDALQAAAVAAVACLASAGLVYLGYLLHVLRVARRAPCEPETAEAVLVFGTHAPDGRVDADFQCRIARAATLLHTQRPRLMVLLGGGPPGVPTEAELAQRGLRALGVDGEAPLLLEAASRDTLQNLRNARALLMDAVPPASPITLLSSRYHLARCALFARQLGLECALCAAEPHLTLRPSVLLRIALEAGYVCWVDLGTRWARLTGNARMLARVT